MYAPSRLLESAAMKRAPILLLLAFAALACSSGNNQRAEIIRPEIDIRQVVGPSDLAYPRGIMEVQYEVRVANRSSEAITLTRIDVQSVGTGAYALRREFFPFNEVIQPDQFKTVTFWVKAFARGRVAGAGANEPVTVRGIASFKSDAGEFNQIFQRDLSQFPRRRE